MYKSRGAIKSHVVTHYSPELILRFGIEGKQCPLCEFQGKFR